MASLWRSLRALTALNNYVQDVHTKFMLIDRCQTTRSSSLGRPTSPSRRRRPTTRTCSSSAAIPVWPTSTSASSRACSHFRFRGMTKTPHHEGASRPDAPTSRKRGQELSPRRRLFATFLRQERAAAKGEPVDFIVPTRTILAHLVAAQPHPDVGFRGDSCGLEVLCGASVLA